MRHGCTGGRKERARGGERKSRAFHISSERVQSSCKVGPPCRGRRRGRRAPTRSRMGMKKLPTPGADIYVTVVIRAGDRVPLGTCLPDQRLVLRRFYRPGQSQSLVVRTSPQRPAISSRDGNSNVNISKDVRSLFVLTQMRLGWQIVRVDFKDKRIGSTTAGLAPRAIRRIVLIFLCRPSAS